MAVGQHLPNGIGDSQTFKRQERALHPIVVIGRTSEDLPARRAGEKLARLRQPEFAKPIFANRTEPFHSPPAEAKIVMHGPSSIGIGGVNDDGAEGEMAGEELSNCQPRAWVLRDPRLWI